jgi:broad specificity phosphatase PhoE
MAEGVAVFLVRHAQTAGNVTGDRLYDPELTALGREQAGRLGRALRAEAPTLVAASPLRRALETATAVAEACGAPLTAWNDLVEINAWDPYTGGSRAELQRRYPLAALEPDMPAGGWSYPGPESDEEGWARVGRVAARLRGLPAGARAVVVAHGTFNSRLLGHLAGLPRAAAVSFAQDNAAVSRFILGPAVLRLLSCNDAAHLQRL